MGENNPEPSLRVYNRHRAKGVDIFSLIHSNCIMAEDLRGEMKYFEIAKKNILNANRGIRGKLTCRKTRCGVVFASVE